MKNCLKTKHCTNQDSVIEHYGDNVWEWITDTIFPGKYFTVSQIADNCPMLDNLAWRTKRIYAGLILANVVLEHKSNPKTCPIERINMQKYQMKKE